MGPLAGIKVIDLSRFVAGPFCSLLLADMGAEVIKVEPPEGDDARYLGSAFLGGESALFLSLNRNKKSLVLDLNKGEGRKVLLHLVKDADVFLENYRPGITTELGIDYENLQKVNPRLIYCSLVAFGEEGPYQKRPGLDMIFQAMGGIMGISGEPEGRPMRPGFPAVDSSSGIMGAYGILLGLYQREKTGQGTKITLALLDNAIAIQTTILSLYFATGKNPPRLGNASPFTLAQDFQTRDGYITISLPNKKFWRKFCEIVNLPELAFDPRFDTNQKRVEHREELDKLCQGIFLEKTTAAWLEILMKAGVPCSPVNTYEDVFRDPQVQFNQVVATLKHPTAGEIKVARSPLKIEGQLMLGEKKPPPLLGQHSQEILEELGYSEAEIKTLTEKGVITPRYSPG